MQRRELTSRQKKILDFIVYSVEDKGYPPTIRQIGEYFHIRSTNGVRAHLSALEKKGFIRRQFWTSRGIEIIEPRVKRLSGGYQPMGTVEAHKGSTPYREVIAEKVEGFLPDEKGLITLRLKGDTLRLWGLNNGDITIVKPQEGLEEGKLMVATSGYPLQKDEDKGPYFFFKCNSKSLKALEGLTRPESQALDGKGDGFNLLGKVVGQIRLFETFF